MAKKNNGWNPSEWLHEQAKKTKDPMKKAKYHNTASKWPTWHDDDALHFDDEENGEGNKRIKGLQNARKARKSIDQLLNYRTKKVR